MKRKTVLAGIPFLFGLLMLELMPHNFTKYVALTFLIVAAIGFVLVKKLRREILLITVSVIFSTFSYFGYQATISPLREYNGKEINFSGVVEGVKLHDGDKATYILDGAINSEDNCKLCFYSEDLSITYNDKIELKAKVSKIENTYLFNARDYYYGKGILLEVEEVQGLSIQKCTNYSIMKWLREYRDGIILKVRSILPDNEGGMLTAMLFGDKSYLDNFAEQSIQRCGIGHIMTVSGLHLSIFAIFVIGVVKLFTVSKKLQFMVLTGMVILFVLLSGMSLSVIRASIMVLVVYSSGVFNRKPDTLNSLCICGILMTAFTPYIVVNASFLLSFSGVFGIGVLAPYLIKDDMGRVLKSIITMLSVSICVFPASVMFFDEVSIISLICNIILLPLCTISLLLGFIVMFTGGISILAVPCLFLAGIFLRIVLVACEYFSQLDFAVIGTGTVWLVPILALLIALILLVFSIKRNSSATLVSIFAAIIVLESISLVNTNLSRDKICVGILGNSQSPIIVIHNRNNTDIFNFSCTEKSYAETDKYIKQMGINEINNIYFSKNVNSRLVSYSKNSIYCNAHMIRIPTDEYFAGSIDNSEIIKSDSFTIDYGKYDIRLNDDEILIELGEFKMVVCENYRKNYDDSSVVIYYGNEPEEISCGELFVPEKNDKYTNNSACHRGYYFAIDADEYGKVRVRRLLDE